MQFSKKTDSKPVKESKLKNKTTLVRKRYEIQGLVQGVGFRPFVFKLAKDLKLLGWVSNTNEGVLIEAQGSVEILNKFLHSLHTLKPKISSITNIKVHSISTVKENDFSIKKSDTQSKPNTIILPDLATCSDCLKDMSTKGNRRYRYPFTNCTNCGPRFSIIQKLPYDRQNTTMQSFKMCLECEKEYNDPYDRRFHAQPNACPECGPQLLLWDANGHPLAEKDSALRLTCNLIREGSIIALKGIGGFQLLIDAANENSIDKLRLLKKRKDKPFALMYPDIAHVKKDCLLSKSEEDLLLSQQAPIVILKAISSPSPNISPNNPNLGVMLPYTPLHHLLLKEINFPIIATSGNRSKEPICIDEYEALSDLKGIADYFLIHNRPIEHCVDDSIVRIVAERKSILRRSRGYSSLPIKIAHSLPSALAVGGQVKNTIAVNRDNTVYISQTIGELENQKSCENFKREVKGLLSLYQISPQFIISDYHPDYYSTKFASQFEKPLKYCQHHVAHIYSCIAENKITPPLMGISWDGTGYGLDDTIWGGEFFYIRKDFSFKRIAYFEPFQLPCSNKAIKEPRLCAIGMLYEVFSKDLFTMKELSPIQTFTKLEMHNLEKILSSGFQSPKCSSVGRIFDGICSILGLRHFITFEGQAAMELEFLSENVDSCSSYNFETNTDKRGAIVIDWKPLVKAILVDIQSNKRKEEIAEKFHNTLVNIIIEISKISKQRKILLSGGVFQNKILTQKSINMLKRNNFDPFWHREVPPNDEGIALGQLFSLTHNSLEN